MQNSKRTKNYCFLTIVSFVNFLIIRKFAHFAFMFKSKQNLFLKWNLLKLKKLQKRLLQVECQRCMKPCCKDIGMKTLFFGLIFLRGFIYIFQNIMYGARVTIFLA